MAKPAKGKLKTSTRAAAKGTWTVAAKPVQFNGRIYLATVKPSKAKVSAGKTTKVTVVYKRASTVSTLRVAKITTSTIKVTFKKPKPTTKVKIRYAAGTKAPKSVTSGKAVAVGSRATSATLKGLKAGKTYSISVFTLVGKKWVGPLTQTVGTSPKAASPDAPTSSYVAAPETVLVAPSDHLTTEATSAGVVATLPSGVTPVIGMPMVLPVTDALPGGFVGKVKSVSADGKTVVLEQAALTEAFDYLDVNVPDIASVSTPVSLPSFTHTRSPGPLSAPTSRFAFGSIAGCGTILNFSPSVPSADGYFKMKPRTDRVLFVDVPRGVSIDTKMSITQTVKFSADVDTGFQCTLDLWHQAWPFWAGPVPMLLDFDSKVDVNATVGGSVTGVGMKVTAGFRAKAHVPLSPADGSFSSSKSLVKNISWITPSQVSKVGLQAKVGGSLAFGPGSAIGAAGMMAGVEGSLYPGTLTFTAARNVTPGLGDWCSELRAGGEVSAGLIAKVWVANWSGEASYDLIKKTWTYGTPMRSPSGCVMGPDLPDSSPTPTPRARAPVRAPA